jgi:hypothetical protein
MSCAAIAPGATEAKAAAPASAIMNDLIIVSPSALNIGGFWDGTMRRFAGWTGGMCS